MFVPEHPCLTAYFTKQAVELDAFNALPEHAARLRINYPLPREDNNFPAGSFFAAGVGLDEARRLWLPWTLDRDDRIGFPLGGRSLP